MRLLCAFFIVLGVLSGATKADVISDILNQLQQPNLDINQLSNQIQGLLQQNGINLADLSNAQQQVSQQLGSLNIQNLTSILAGIDINQLLSNPDAILSQINNLQAQLNSLLGSSQSINDLTSLLNSTGLLTLLGPVISALNTTDINQLISLIPMVNQTILAQQLAQSRQFTQIVQLFANGSYDLAIPQLFQFFNVTPYLGQFLILLNRSSQLDPLTNDLTLLLTQLTGVIDVFGRSTSITGIQLINAILLIDNTTLTCLNAISQALSPGGSSTLTPECASFTNQANYTALLNELRARNLSIAGLAATLQLTLVDFQTYLNQTGEILMQINFQDFTSRVVNSLLAWIIPSLQPTTTTTTTTTTPRTTTSNSVNLKTHVSFVLIPSVVTFLWTLLL